MMVVLRKANFHSVDMCRLMKINHVKKERQLKDQEKN